MKLLIHTTIAMAMAIPSYAQITGTVRGMDNGKAVPIPYAHVHWEGTDIATLTDSLGRYEIEKDPGSIRLVAEANSYVSQVMLVISRAGTFNFTLDSQAEELNTVTVTAESNSTLIDLESAQFALKLDEKELRKAACCNLSESFETNATVDVTFADAVTGTKQIEMLGLSGKYILIQRENIPFARGLNASSGMTFIPGPFVSDIHLSKGLSSVVNGYESISGQINVTYRQPENKKDFAINGYANMGGRMETNIYLASPITDSLESSLLVHLSTTPFAQDLNSDGFSDLPVGSQFNLHNRWKYIVNDEWGGQFGVNYVHDERKSGQLEGLSDEESGVAPWIFEENTDRLELFGMTGYMDLTSPYRSIGFLYGGNYHKRDAQIGVRNLDGSQISAYFNAIYQDIFVSTDHTYRTGISFQFDQIEENLFDTLSFANAGLNLNRSEAVPGVFFEYTYTHEKTITLVAGSRLDYNHLFGWIFTPRLHLRYMPTSTTTLRVGGGRGQRTANPLFENISGMASGRSVHLSGTDLMNTEIAWNFGGSVTQNFILFKHAASITADAYYTHFDQKLITDFDHQMSELWLYYAGGSSSFNFMTQLDFSPLHNLDIRLAYKYLDSRDAFLRGTETTYGIPDHRAFINASYDWGSGWKTDATANWFNSRRMPATTGYPAALQGDAYSPDYTQFNLQVNKSWESGWEVYAGVENLFNTRQRNPITDAGNPYSSYFDTNRIYGPIFGRMIYAGFYYSL